MSIPFIEENDQTEARREHLEELRKLVGNVYPNKFERSRTTGNEDTITAIVEHEDFKRHVPEVRENERPAQDELERANAELNKVEVRISGRISSPPRVMGKAAFVHLSDGVSRLQIYVRKADVKGIHNDDGAPIEEGWELFNLLDHGDFIGATGYLFVTKTGELSVHVRELQFLAKAMLPMPDKLHGISDPEIRQRQRYADLIAGSLKVELAEDGSDAPLHELSSREVFVRRSKIITEMRRFLDDHGYIEVETPMLIAKATGAAARPFKTHHNALDIDLYARIAPELYLKRLLVGGFERVYELNRNFRNEGISTRHNPEFTMLEFYCAYMDVNGMMGCCEELIRTIVEKATGSTRVAFGSDELDFARKFERLTMKQAIVKHWPAEWLELGGEQFNENWLADPERVLIIFYFIWEQATNEAFKLTNRVQVAWAHAQEIVAKPGARANEPEENRLARHVQFIFENVAEHHLIEPTFITDVPKPISPLSKASPADPTIAERFELYISKMEVANGFSELNDPLEQYERFLEQRQQRESGGEVTTLDKNFKQAAAEAMELDEDYLHALAYGMPPAAGIGIGIDRLVMILTNRHSIRDVILFPHMRPQMRHTE